MGVRVHVGICVICFCFQLSVQCVDVIVVFDQSFSMEPFRDWLPRMASEIEGDLTRAGFGIHQECRNMYALVGYGRHSPNPLAYTMTLNNQSLVMNSSFADLVSRLPALVYGAHREDGYEAINHALENVPFRKKMSISSSHEYHVELILISDEDRDVVDQNATRSTIQSKLYSYDARLHVIIDNTLNIDTVRTLGVSTTGSGQRGYVAVRGNTKRQCAVVGLSTAVGLGKGYAKTREHYTELALQVQGSVWDTNQLKRSSQEACGIAFGLGTAVQQSMLQVRKAQQSAISILSNTPLWVLTLWFNVNYDVIHKTVLIWSVELYPFCWWTGTLYY